MPVLNIVLILALILLILGALWWYFKKISKTEDQMDFENPYTIKHIVSEVADEFSLALKVNLKEQNLSRRELEAKENAKQELRTSLKEAAFGNPSAKQYVKNFIKDIIRGQRINIAEDTIDSVISFANPTRLTSRDKFEIMLYFYIKEYSESGFTQMVKDYDWLKPKVDSVGGISYSVTEDELNEAFKDFIKRTPIITYNDKLDIVAQRVFSEYKGFGAVDILFDCSIDEIDGGVSGVPQNTFDIKNLDFGNLQFSFECIWVMVKGVNLKLEFLSLGSQDELMRICSNVYKYNAPICLSRRNPTVVSTMKDGSRVVVARPPACDSWTFFVRKFDSMPSLAPEYVLPDDGHEAPLTLIKWLIRGYTTMAITGMQGTGKTTLLKSIITYFPKFLNIRVQELEFETNLRYTYPDRNIVTLQETDNFTAQEGLNLQKKMNGSCNILGEVATAEAASWLIQTAMVASLFAMFTHHAKTTKDLVIAIRNNLLDSKGGAGFQNEEAAEDMVARAINVDVHMVNVRGHRYCERITEIIPINDRRYPSEMPENSGLSAEDKLTLDTMEHQKRDTDRELFRTVDLVVFENGRYVFKNAPSDDLMAHVYQNLSETEAELCKEELKGLRKYA